MAVSIIHSPTPATIDVLELDASVSEEHGFEADVTEHPVEKGANITDHVRQKPRTVRITGIVSNTPLPSFTAPLANLGAGDRAVAAWQNLQEIHLSGKLVTVVTSLEEYADMALVSVSVPRDAQRGNVLEFTAVLRQVTTVESESVSAPDAPRPRRKSKGKQATKPAPEARQSALSRLAGAVGNLF